MNRELKIGKRNATFQHIMVIKTNRYKRFEHKEIFVEGVRNINIAIKNGFKVKHWIYDENKNLSSWAKEKIANIKTECNYVLTNELMSEVSGKNDVSELVAILEMKNRIITESQNPFIILFDRPSKKGNLGSIIRSADAFGADGIIVTGHSVDIFDPDIITSSMGSYFAIPVQKLDTNEQVLELFKKFKSKYNNLQVVATTELGDDNIRSFDFKKPTILMIGNESLGLSKFLLENSDHKIKIPMVGEASSFNASCAGSIFMYEIFSQRNFN